MRSPEPLPQLTGALTVKDPDLIENGIAATLNFLEHTKVLHGHQSSYRRNTALVLPQQKLSREIDEMRARGASSEQISDFARSWNNVENQ